MQESSVQRRLATPSDTSLCTDCAIPDTACMQRERAYLRWIIFTRFLFWLVLYFIITFYCQYKLKNIICSLQKKKPKNKTKTKPNSTASSAQPYLFARTSLLPGSGCCDSSDHPTICVTRYTYRNTETIAHMKKRNTDWALHARVGHHWIKVTNVLQ